MPSSLQFFAEVGDGGGLRTVFLVMNPGNENCHVTLVLFRDDGTPRALPLNGISGPNVNVDIPPGGSVRLASPAQAETAVFVSALLGGNPRKGSLQIEATGPVAVTTLQQTGLVLATLPVATLVLRSQ